MRRSDKHKHLATKPKDDSWAKDFVLKDLQILRFNFYKQEIFRQKTCRIKEIETNNDVPNFNK